MKIAFHGADRCVTGSCHLLECAGKRILVDCGMYQGGRELSKENVEPFGFDPAAIDYLLLSHAHLDHCGRIPLLVKRGFQGEIITIAASVELAQLVMLDADGLQEDAALATRSRWDCSIASSRRRDTFRRCRSGLATGSCRRRRTDPRSRRRCRRAAARRFHRRRDDRRLFRTP